MSKLLLTVEDAFTISGRALVVLPFLATDFFGDRKIKNGQPIRVRIVRRDGTQEETQAALWWEHLNPIGYRLACAFPTMTKEQVPIGTEIWLREDF